MKQIVALACAALVSSAGILVVGGPLAAQDFPSKCFVSDAPSSGGLEGDVRTAIISDASHGPARPGEDGAVTAQIRAVKVGAQMPATVVDRANFQIQEGAPLYPVRVTLATCTDYRTRVVHNIIERNYACFTRSTGGFACSQTARSADLQQDVQRSVNK
jgi:hypothetical protein